MAYECFEERASLPAILINGVRAKNVRFGLVTVKKWRHKPDSDGLPSVPIIVFLVYAEEFSKVQSAWWVHENSVLLSVLKLYEYNICRHVDLGLGSSHFHPLDIWAIMGYRFIFYFSNQRISHFSFSSFFLVIKKVLKNYIYIYIYIF